jgi:Kef-type K+ transport system membrane component KefB
MTFVDSMQTWIDNLRPTSLLVIGILTAAGFYTGKSAKYIRLPSLIGFMVIGLIAGPSLLGLLDEALMDRLSFITEIALGFVALSIGMELKLSVLKRQGKALLMIILFESFLAFFVVTGGVYVLTKNLPLALLFGAIAPASAPAGTVAVIKEYRARGSLTNALYSVVGFDDGLGIIIFGFVSAAAKSIVLQENGNTVPGFVSMVGSPILEILFALMTGAGAAFLFGFLVRKLSNPRDIFILAFAFVLIVAGISLRFHFSVILSNMTLGIVIVNTNPDSVIRKIRTELTDVMPLLFLLFFILAGANLNVSILPSIGILGIVYIFSRSGGLMAGAWIGAVTGKADSKIKKYLGMGILSQAGVAIGLALTVKHEFITLGPAGFEIGSAVITTITAASIVFEVIGPIFTKIGLKKAGEI